MARSFTAASSQYLTTAAVVVTDGPLSVSLWYFPTSTAADQELWGIYDNSGASVNDAFRFECDFSSTGGNVLHLVSRHNGSETSSNNGVAAPTINTWNSIVGTISGAISSTPNSLIYLNGTVGGTTSLSSLNIPTGLVRTNIASYNFGAGGIGNFVSGQIADVAVWNVALTAVEAKALSLGVRPFTIRPLNLVGYWPIDGIASPEPDLSGKAHNMTLTASPPIAAGPPVMQFTPRWPQTTPSAVISSSTVFRRSLSPVGTRVGSRQAVQ